MFTPQLISVRHIDADDPKDANKRQDVRLGIGFALIWSFILAAVFAEREGNGRPYFFWALAAGGMFAAYELMLHTKPPPKPADADN